MSFHLKKFIKTRLLLIFVFLLCQTFQAFAKTITFPVHGLKVATKKSVPIEMDWDESCFLDANPKVYNHKIARLSAMLSNISYVHVEKNPDTNEMLQSYQLLGFKKENICWHYNLDYSDPMAKNNQAAYSFAFKDIQTAQGTKKLVFMIIRGTPLSANEWQSNLDISDSTQKKVMVHEGFLSTCGIIKADFYKFLDENSIPKNDSYFLISGHSRGAALANLLGSILYDEQVITSDKVFVYTFASPNVSQEEKTEDEKYGFIWNIVNAEDAVPTVPPNRNNWHWKKFGNTRVIVNYWNTDPNTYNDDYYPRMNEYYKKLLLRDYSPFKSGPFFQSQAARMLTTVYSDVDNYYWQGLHFMAAIALNLAFPDETKKKPEPSEDENATQPTEEEETEDQPEEIKVPFVLKPIRWDINRHFDSGFEYIINAAIDMHACESYLSWMLALEENELFSTLGSSEIVIDGAMDCAVYDDEGKLLLRIINGAIEIFSLRVPIGAMPLPYKNVLGFPANQKFNVILHKDSLIPTVLGYKIEHYDVAGKLISTSKKSHFYPYSNLSVRFVAGKDTFEKDTLDYEELTRKEAKPLVKKYALNENFKFKFEPEASYTLGRVFSLGTRIGAPVFYGTILGDFHSKKSYGISTGIGHQHIIYGRLLFDSEVFARYTWTKIDDKKEFDIVPQARLSLAYKPLRRAHYFLAAVADIHIDGFNDDAFSKTARKSYFSSIRVNDKIRIQPTIQIGARF